MPGLRKRFVGALLNSEAGALVDEIRDSLRSLVRQKVSRVTEGRGSEGPILEKLTGRGKQEVQQPATPLLDTLRITPIEEGGRTTALKISDGVGQARVVRLRESKIKVL